MKVRRTLAAVAALALFAACSSDGDDKKDVVDKPTALPLTAHVIDDLPGFVADGEPAPTSVAEFAELHDKTVAELEEIGMVGGAGLEHAPDGEAPGTAMSVAMQFDTAEQAQAEAARLFASNSEAEEGTTATPVDVPGIPGGKAVQLDGEMEGQQVRGLEVVFVDGTVLHELFAFTLASGLSVEDLVAAATELYERVEGHPVES